MKIVFYLFLSFYLAQSDPLIEKTTDDINSNSNFLLLNVKSKNYKYELTLTKLSGKTKPSHPPRHRSVKDGKITNNLSVYIPNPNGKNVGDFFSNLFNLRRLVHFEFF